MLTEKVKNDAKRYPAVLIDQITASKIASVLGAVLPSESQFEYAARSGGLEFQFATKLRIGQGAWKNANLRGNNEDDDPFPRPVMSFDKGRDETQQGVFDLTGNVREMTRDGYQPYQDGKNPEDAVTDPVVKISVAADGKPPKCVVRGGSYTRIPEEALTYQRDSEAITNRDRQDLGFRCVIECPPSPKPRP